MVEAMIVTLLRALFFFIMGALLFYKLWEAFFTLPEDDPRLNWVLIGMFLGLFCFFFSGMALLMLF